MKIAILYPRVIDLDGSRLTVGGIQNYLLSLADICIDKGWEPAIIQLGNRDFSYREGRIEVHGHAGPAYRDNHMEVGRFLTAKAAEWLGSGNGIIIYGIDLIAVESGKIPSIAIQHGVMNDLPPAGNGDPPRPGIGSFIRKSGLYRIYRSYLQSKSLESLYRGVESAGTVVLVDYNFYNNYKTLGRDNFRGSFVTIPNFTAVASRPELDEKLNAGSAVNIIFARRFEWYRGTRLIAPVARRLIEKHEDIRFTFAGEGPDEDWLKRYFAGVPRVSFTRYGHGGSMGVFLQNHIAVVPSLGSEGTSLAALEAMGAGCAVVATCVGGLTNIILDNFNGRMVMPDGDQLYGAINELVENPRQRGRLAANAYETIVQSFTKDAWREKWQSLLNEVEARHFS